MPANLFPFSITRYEWDNTVWPPYTRETLMGPPFQWFFLLFESLDSETLVRRSMSIAVEMLIELGVFQDDISGGGEHAFQMLSGTFSRQELDWCLDVIRSGECDVKPIRYRQFLDRLGDMDIAWQSYRVRLLELVLASFCDPDDDLRSSFGAAMEIASDLFAAYWVPHLPQMDLYDEEELTRFAKWGFLAGWRERCMRTFAMDRISGAEISGGRGLRRRTTGDTGPAPPSRQRIHDPLARPLLPEDPDYPTPSPGIIESVLSSNFKKMSCRNGVYSIVIALDILLGQGALEEAPQFRAWVWEGRNDLLSVLGGTAHNEEWLYQQTVYYDGQAATAFDQQHEAASYLLSGVVAAFDALIDKPMCASNLAGAMLAIMEAVYLGIGHYDRVALAFLRRWWSEVRRRLPIRDISSGEISLGSRRYDVLSDSHQETL